MSTLYLPFALGPQTQVDPVQYNANLRAIANLINGNLDFTNFNLSALVVYTTTNTQTFGDGVTGDTNPRLVMNTSNGLLGGSGSAVPDVGLVRSATNTWQINNAAGGAATLDLNGGKIINFPQLVLNHGRAYLVTGQPYTDGALAGNSTIYYGPCSDRGNQITLDDGSGHLTTYTLSELSLSLTLTNGSAYYLWLQNSGGPSSLGVTVWTNPTTPPATSTDAAGRLTVSGATNKLIVAGIYAIAANTTVNSINQRHVSNHYNKIFSQLSMTRASDGPANEAVFTALGTNIGVYRFEVFQSLAEDAIPIVYRCQLQNNTANGVTYFGIGKDSVTVAVDYVLYQSYVANSIGAQGAGMVFQPDRGYHYFQELVGASGVTLGTWTGANVWGAIFN
jgi:hypothetical protein